MRHFIQLLLAFALIFQMTPSFARKANSSGSHHVNGHTKKNGTYVKPHNATNPNHTQRDNWSSKPNVNPHNGKKGTKSPDH